MAVSGGSRLQGSACQQSRMGAREWETNGIAPVLESHILLLTAVVYKQRGRRARRWRRHRPARPRGNPQASALVGLQENGPASLQVVARLRILDKQHHALPATRQEHPVGVQRVLVAPPPTTEPLPESASCAGPARGRCPSGQARSRAPTPGTQSQGRAWPRRSRIRGPRCAAGTPRGCPV